MMYFLQKRKLKIPLFFILLIVIFLGFFTIDKVKNENTRIPNFITGSYNVYYYDINTQSEISIGVLELTNDGKYVNKTNELNHKFFTNYPTGNFTVISELKEPEFSELEDRAEVATVIFTNDKGESFSQLLRKDGELLYFHSFISTLELIKIQKNI